jgi:hypothetical protein
MPPVKNKRASAPRLSPVGQHALDQFGQRLRAVEDLRPATVHNYLSDVRHFIAWCESRWRDVREDESEDETQGVEAHDGEAPIAFVPAAVTTPTLTTYRAYLQLTLSETDRSRLHIHFAEGGVEAARSRWSATSGHSGAGISLPG